MRTVYSRIQNFIKYLHFLYTILYNSFFSSDGNIHVFSTSYSMQPPYLSLTDNWVSCPLTCRPGSYITHRTRCSKTVVDSSACRGESARKWTIANPINKQLHSSNYKLKLKVAAPLVHSLLFSKEPQ